MNDQSNIGYVDENGYHYLGDGLWYDPADGSTYSESTGQWTAGATVLPATTVVVGDLNDAASSGWNIGEFTNGLMQLGYTAAQIAMLYQNVKSSQEATPQVLSYLQQENAYLKQRTGGDNTKWMIVGVAGLAALFLWQNRRQAA